MRLSQKHEEAITLLAEDRLTDAEIAAKVGTPLRTLHDWKRNPAFATRLAEVVSEYAEKLKRRSIARKDYRLRTLDDLHTKLLTIISERANHKDVAGSPGASTGLIVRQVRAVGTGQGQKLVPEYVIDANLLRELRATQEQVAKELGHLIERKEVKFRALRDMTDDELAALAAEYQDAAGTSDSVSGVTGTGETETES